MKVAVHDAVLEIIIDNPPVNALGGAVRRALFNAVTGAQTDDEVNAIVIRGAGRLFSAGADIQEFGKPPVEPTLPQLIAHIEQSAKPVVAAIHGNALGGGLELALGCHYRVATPDAKLGLPEVTLGLLPGAGGTQRMPRLVGLEKALDMIAFGKPVSGTQAAAIGLVDTLADAGMLQQSAIAFARQYAGAGPRPVRPEPVQVDPAVIDHFAQDNARKFNRLDAPAACIEAVRNAILLPLPEGLAKERELFLNLMQGNQSAALRHMFFAERAAARIEGLAPDAKARPITRVGVIGAGTMGGGIAMNCLSSGIAVTIVETAQDALDRGVATIRRNYEASAAKERFTADQVDRAMALLHPTLDFDALGQCDLVIEAVYENMDVKKEIFSRLDRVARPGAILASNTSYLSIDDIAAATDRPRDVLGLHFFSPANVMKLVEVVRGAQTGDDVLATAMDLARRIGKVPVVSGVCYGFIGNRMLTPRRQNALRLLLEGATPEQIDRVHTDFGMPMGPFQMTDLAGVDIGWHRDPDRIESLQDALCAAGRWGQKTHAGYYEYDERRKPTPSPVTSAIVAEFRERAGIAPRNVTDGEIMVATMYTMVNEAAKILEEGIAQRGSDIDVVWHHGYGWPRHTGGPVHWANQLGLTMIVDGLRHYAPELGPDFTLSRLLLDRAAEGRPL